MISGLVDWLVSRSVGQLLCEITASKL